MVEAMLWDVGQRRLQEMRALTGKQAPASSELKKARREYLETYWEIAGQYLDNEGTADT